MEPVRQHLIDPEVCIRCNTCEATCPKGAISHDDNNYVVDANVCKLCMDCISPCPTGAIDSWRMVQIPYSPEQQLLWDELPEDIAPADVDTRELSPDMAAAEPFCAVEGLEERPDGRSRRVSAPWSAPEPFINLYSREQPALARVVGNRRITGAGAQSDIHHIILDFGNIAFPVLEGQSIGIVPPGRDDAGKPHLVRLYSVASPRDGERPGHNNLALTVKRVRYQEENVEKEGVGSGFMCDLKPGDEVAVTGPFGQSFLMPDHATANIIMICTGTGAAPFRAMTERRRRRNDATGKLLLFFGARTQDELPYFGPLTKLPQSLIDTELVFSRLSGQPREYVQDRMRTRASDLAELLGSEDTFLYLCGLKEMESGVEQALAEICDDHQLVWSELKARMRDSGRYHVETY